MGRLHRSQEPGETPLAGGSVRAATLGGIRWYAVVRVLAETSALATSVVLARLLTPSAFGSVAIAQAVYALTSGGIVIGLTAPLVQRKAAGPEAFEATSFLSLVATAAIVATLLLVAPLVTRPLFGDQTTSLVQLSAFALPFSALSVVPTAHLQRRLDFRRLSAFELMSQLFGAAVSVAAALAGARGAAIIFGTIALAAIQAAMVCASAPLARPVPHRRTMRELLGFGGSAGTASVINTAYQNIDYMIIGTQMGMLSSATTGERSSLASSTRQRLVGSCFGSPFRSTLG